MNPLLTVRKIILTCSAILAVAMYVIVTAIVPVSSLRTIRLTEGFALLALAFLYTAILISPLTLAFPMLPGKTLLIRARRAIGVSAFFFALIHACLAFFGLLGGFPGLSFLSTTYLQAITLSFTGLCILAFMAATSFDTLVRRLGRRWKRLHRLVYLAGVFITIHALMLGSHFADISRAIPQVFFAALMILFFLEALRFDRYIVRRFDRSGKFGLAFTFVSIVFGALLAILYIPSAGLRSLGIHAPHLQLVQQQQAGTISSTTIGDPNLRYSVSLAGAEMVAAKQNVTLRFTVTDAGTGAPVSLFNPIYTKPAHLVIVDSRLQYFRHLHPDPQTGGFTLTTSFPTNETYHLYLNFQPLGALEQQFAFRAVVGPAGETRANVPAPDIIREKIFGDWRVVLNTHGILRASAVSTAKQKISFAITETKNGQPVTSLRPYLGAFGHLVMINTKTFSSVHVHPISLTPPQPTDTAGPTVDFVPLALYGPIQPGTYKLLAEFNDGEAIRVIDYVVTIQ